jgi:hypothetical protein
MTNRLNFAKPCAHCEKREGIWTVEGTGLLLCHRCFARYVLRFGQDPSNEGKVLSASRPRIEPERSDH